MPNARVMFLVPVVGLSGALVGCGGSGNGESEVSVNGLVDKHEGKHGRW